MQTGIAEEQLLTKEQAAVYLQISSPTLDRLVKDEQIIPVRIGRNVRFKKEALDNIKQPQKTIKTNQ
jgi:excisionase family DNA binding protein